MSPERTDAASAARVAAFLESHQLGEAIVHFGSTTETAARAAETIGCELGQIAKSLVFVADGTPALAIVAGDRRGDPAAIARELGAASAKFADPATVLSATGYTVGGVSPFDLPGGMVVLVDESLDRFDVVFPAAGTASSMVRLTLGQLLDITSGRACAISR